jgi:hypothetical protein
MPKKRPTGKEGKLADPEVGAVPAETPVGRVTGRRTDEQGANPVGGDSRRDERRSALHITLDPSTAGVSQTTAQDRVGLKAQKVGGHERPASISPTRSIHSWTALASSFSLATHREAPG